MYNFYEKKKKKTWTHLKRWSENKIYSDSKNQQYHHAPTP